MMALITSDCAPTSPAGVRVRFSHGSTVRQTDRELELELEVSGVGAGGVELELGLEELGLDELVEELVEEEFERQQEQVRVEHTHLCCLAALVGLALYRQLPGRAVGRLHLGRNWPDARLAGQPA